LHQNAVLFFSFSTCSLVLQQTAHLFMDLAFSEGGILSTKFPAVSLSGISVFNGLPRQGGSKAFLGASNNYFYYLEV
jgi:hypothetical protein